MNIPMIKALVKKDWLLYRRYIVAYSILGIAATFLMIAPSVVAYYIGQVLLVTVLIGASAHISISSVVTEKKEEQLSFIMGLPLNVTDYVISKTLGVLAIYSVCWGVIVATLVFAIDISGLSDGLLPMAIVCSLEILVATALLLSIGILSGSEPITIVSMVVLNLFFNVFLFSMARIPGIGNNLWGDVAVFSPTVFTIIAVEIVLIVSITLGTIGIKSRQQCFM